MVSRSCGEDDLAVEVRGGLVDPLLLGAREGRGHGMREHERAHAAALGGLRRFLDARVVVEDVLQACGRDGA